MANRRSEMPPKTPIVLKWNRTVGPDGVHIESACGRFCVQHTNSTAGGPWYVTYDEDRKDAGFGFIVLDRFQSQHAAKEAVDQLLSGKVELYHSYYFRERIKKNPCETCRCAKFVCGGPYCLRTHGRHQRVLGPIYFEGTKMTFSGSE